MDMLHIKLVKKNIQN